jgi:hypothetical protein
MNYEIKSAREASLQEIFYDKNTNKLSYKDKLGIITVIDESNSNCDSAYKTNIFENYPYSLEPSMLKTCTSAEQIGNGMFPLGEKLQTYKIGGALSLGNEPSANILYLGSVEDLNISFPWKLTGSVDAFDDDFGTYIQSALATGAFMTDLSTGLTVSTGLVSILTEYFPGGMDLYLVYFANTLNNIGATIAFEFEFATLASDNPVFIFV